MNLKLWVIAWTPIDTKFWKSFLKSFTNKEVLSYAISKTPDEQNLLQLNQPEKLYNLCLKKCLEFKSKWINKVIIYCNSLSSSINIEKLKIETWIKIITPLEIYSKIWKKYKNILMITANSTWAVVPEKIIRKVNPNIKISSFWFLELVNQIENQKPVYEIINNLWLKSLLTFSEETNVDLILLACTHFPYIKNELQKYSKIKILDLNEWFKKLLF